MRSLLVVAAVLASPAFAQAISGTLTGTFEGFNEFGVPQTRLTLSLACSLTCGASAPVKTFRVNGGTSGYFVNESTESTGYVGTGFGSDPTGQNSYVSEQFEAGTAFVLKAKSATCHCGNAFGEGGYVDLESQPVVIPPWVTAGYIRAGDDSAVVVSAQPKGPETVTVKLLGAGLDQSLTLTPTDFGTNKSTFARFKPLSGGALEVTATLQPHGATRTLTIDVPANPNAGTGGGSGSTGGGSGGGGGDEPEPGPFGCSTGALAPALGLALALLRRRR